MGQILGGAYGALLHSKVVNDKNIKCSTIFLFEIEEVLFACLGKASNYSIGHYQLFFLLSSLKNTNKFSSKTSLHLHLWDWKQEIETITNQASRERKRNKQKSKISTRSVHVHLAQIWVTVLQRSLVHIFFLI